MSENWCEICHRNLKLPINWFMDCFQNPIDQLWMEVTARLIVSVGKKSRRTQGRCGRQITIEGVLTYVNFAKERTAATCFVKSSKRLSTQMDDLLLIIFVRVSFVLRQTNPFSRQEILFRVNICCVTQTTHPFRDSIRSETTFWPLLDLRKTSI